jgi:hypothetical protein
MTYVKAFGKKMKKGKVKKEKKKKRKKGKIRLFSFPSRSRGHQFDSCQ